ncbi:MAG: hypothetical protein ACLTG4_07740 [Oscillospiraceae bacterium]
MRRTMAFHPKHYNGTALVVICIVLTVLAQLNGTLFLQKLYDSYLSPMRRRSTDFTPAAQAHPGRRGLRHRCAVLVGLYPPDGQCLAGRDAFREKLFGHMESPPIVFRHAFHGDIMSVYTNDIDTLRQFIGRACRAVFQHHQHRERVRQHDQAHAKRRC